MTVATEMLTVISYEGSPQRDTSSSSRHAWYRHVRGLDLWPCREPDKSLGTGQDNIRRMPSSVMLRRVALLRTDISEDRGSSIIRVIRIGALGTVLAASNNRRTLRRNTILNSVIYYTTLHYTTLHYTSLYFTILYYSLHSAMYFFAASVGC
jgi:hypothetical protein